MMSEKGNRSRIFSSMDYQEYKKYFPQSPCIRPQQSPTELPPAIELPPSQLESDEAFEKEKPYSAPSKMSLLRTIYEESLNEEEAHNPLETPTKKAQVDPARRAHGKSIFSKESFSRETKDTPQLRQRSQSENQPSFSILRFMELKHRQ
eukprot:TRINITY_DN826_c0_g2_i1.p1 TRINITY_DN826_c0_g2~~TRINITY_DN826_c0_g2_i1.p1  ORF type:complete len:149 (-),score=26.34 TRINITY_DN826_c0_g2_i1:173-619(-)